MQWFQLIAVAVILASLPILCQGFLGIGSFSNRVPLWPAEGLHASTDITSRSTFPFSTTFGSPTKIIKFPNIGTKAPTPTSGVAKSLPTVESSDENLPWTNSVDPGKKLSYMNFFSHQLSMLRKLGFQESKVGEQFVCQESSVKPARIGNMCFSGGKFRKVRMTYFDAGESVQVFNTLWYPRYEYDLPLLGIDLISLGKNRVLNVIDCQPLYPTKDYAGKHIDFLSPIRAKYPDLHGQLSGKIYDDTSFFSSQMLFGRFTDESKLSTSVFPAFQEYLSAYLDHAEHAEADTNPEAMAVVKGRQAAYDAYSALKDPAVGLFDAYFGKEWSEHFVHDFLFTLSDKPSKRETAGSKFSSGKSTAPSETSSSLSVARAHNFKVDNVTGAVIVQSSSAVSPSQHTTEGS
jgi:15,16-dihydrobiliverdin:ferredoxin oxidoreductase